MLDPKTSLDHAHDIAETLQYCCEGIDSFETLVQFTMLTSNRVD